MDQIIVKNRQSILLGPMPWRQRMFQKEIDDLFDAGDISVRYEIGPIAPESKYLDLGEGIEIFPVVSLNVPAYDPLYEQLAGPYYTFTNNEATASYNAVPVSLEQSKGALKVVVTDNRYRKEQAGIKLTIQGNDVSIDTARGSRDIFLQTYAMMNDTETINWKFPEMWIPVTKADMGYIVSQGKAHIQNCFDWELSTHGQIDTAQTVEELKAIDLGYLTSVENSGIPQ